MNMLYVKDAIREGGIFNVQVRLRAFVAWRSSSVKKKRKNSRKNQKICIGRCRNMKNLFTVEESNLICIFQSDSRTKVMEDINRALKHIGDTDMIELCENVLEKLGKMNA